MALTGKGADLVEAFPSVLLALEPLDSLCLRFFDFGAHRSPLAEKRKTHVSDKRLTRGLGMNLL
jgi:hypothetical protein